jgi:hypothetical protein
MARGVFSTLNYFVCGGSVVTPCTLAGWIYSGALTQSQYSIGAYYTGGAAAALDGFTVRLSSDGTCLARVGDGSGVSGNPTANTMLANSWGHIGGVFASATSRYTYLNGVASAQSTINRSPSNNPNKLAIGLLINQDNSVTGPSTERFLAEIGFWNVALTAADMLQLAAGYSPLFVKPESLVAYYPMIRGDANGDMPDLMGGLKMVEQGTVAVASHPRVFYPVRYRITFKTSGAKVLIVANAAHAQSAENVALTQHQALAVADAEQAQSAENVALTQHQTLAVADAEQAQSAENVALTQHQALAVADAEQAQSAENVALTQHQALAVADATHAQSVNNVVLTVNLVVADASHAQSADSVALTQHQALAVAGARHIQIANNVTLGGAVVLVVQDARHIQSADSVSFYQDYFLFILFIAMAHRMDGYITRSRRMVGQKTGSIEVETEL